ncbi:oligosaccharide flippase family protein [Aliivibrio logei]|uniref:Uncharacterized protein n=1 Tax=Aliivibrio logei TaxID=688 RepID=A0A1B9NVF4_ALILO|nr:oligosaccharide flippase family protein [Aliivibrio logei]OCH18574.1 hypothetical protein A6E04_01765 [Aliivibrio logei]
MSKLVKNSILYTTLSIFEKSFMFFMLPVYTAYLSPEDLGQYSLVVAINAFLILLYSLSLEHGLGKFYYDYKDDDHKVKILFSTIYSSVFFASIMFTFLFFVSYDFLFFKFSENEQLYELLKTGLLCIVFFPCYSMFKQMYQVKQDAKKYGLISFSYTLLLVIINVVLIVLFGMKSEGLLYGLLCVNIIFFCYSTISFFKNNGFFYDFKLLLKVLKYSFPLLPHSISSVVTSMSDRILIGFFLTLSSVGLYTISSQVSFIFGVLISAFSMAYGPVFFEKIKGEEKGKIELLKIANIGVPIFCFIGVSLSFFSKEIIMVMVSDDYLEAYKYAMILIFVFVFQSVYIFTAGPLLVSSTKIYALVSILSSVLNVILNILLIPIYYIYGAAIATLISKIVSVFLYSYFGYKSKDRLDFNFKLLIGLPFFSLFLVFSLEPLINQQSMWIEIGLKIFISFIFLMSISYFNKDIFLFVKSNVIRLWAKK